MYMQWAAACCREKRWTGCRCNMSVVAVKNWSNPQHLSWSASSIPASRGTSCTLRPLQSDDQGRDGKWALHLTKWIGAIENEKNESLIHHRWTRTVRVGSREGGGSSTRWVHLRCAGLQLLHPLASLWLSYTCEPKAVARSHDYLTEILKEKCFLCPFSIYWHGWFIFARPSIRYEGKTPTGSVVKCHTDTPQVNVHSIGFLMGLAQHSTFIHIWVLKKNT